MIGALVAIEIFRELVYAEDDGPGYAPDARRLPHVQLVFQVHLPELHRLYEARFRFTMSHQVVEIQRVNKTLYIESSVVVDAEAAGRVAAQRQIARIGCVFASQRRGRARCPESRRRILTQRPWATSPSHPAHLTLRVIVT